MPKVKNKQQKETKGYLQIAIGIFLAVFCLLMIGRVGATSYVTLLLTLLLGDFMTIVLVFTIFFCIKDLVFKSKVDLHHIFILGGVFIYIGVSMFCHLGLYDALDMSNSTILNKTLDLYQRYLNHYEPSYSTGGGIIVALLCQVIGFLCGKLGIIILAMAFILVGLCYIVNIRLIELLKKGNLKRKIIAIGSSVISYFKNIHYPNNNKEYVPGKIPVSILMDNEEPVNFTLQEEINKERLEELREYVKKNHILCLVDSVSTSYTSSRYMVKLAHKSENVLKELSGYFNKCCFFIVNNVDVSIEVTNQFKKLLTLKNVLSSTSKKKDIILAIDVDNQGISLDFTNGRMLAVIGDLSSGVKTFVRCFVTTLLFKEYHPNSIYFYDLYNEFSQLSDSSINYINNERSAAISFDEAFNEYERRMASLKYLDAFNVDEANKKIAQMGKEYEPILPEFHLIFFNPNRFDATLLQKLNYVIRFGVKVGINVILVMKDKGCLLKVDIHNGDIISFFLGDVPTSIKLFGSDIACRLQKKGDVLVQTNGRIYHGQTPYISLDDFDNVIEKI